MREIVFHLRQQLCRGASGPLIAQAAGYPLAGLPALAA